MTVSKPKVLPRRDLDARPIVYESTLLVNEWQEGSDKIYSGDGWGEGMRRQCFRKRQYHLTLLEVFLIGAPQDRDAVWIEVGGLAFDMLNHFNHHVSRLFLSHAVAVLIVSSVVVEKDAKKVANQLVVVVHIGFFQKQLSGVKSMEGLRRARRVPAGYGPMSSTNASKLSRHLWQTSIPFAP